MGIWCGMGIVHMEMASGWVRWIFGSGEFDGMSLK
jgi:hypothetical protein